MHHALKHTSCHRQPLISSAGKHTAAGLGWVRVSLTTLQAVELGLIWEAQQLPGVSPQEVYLQNGCGGGCGQHIPHGVVLRNGLGLAGQPDVPPVAHLWSLHTCTDTDTSSATGRQTCWSLCV